MSKVNHPSHYNQGKFEAIDVIEDWNLGFNLGNTVKYIARAGHKDDIIQDLEKALWYLQREIDNLKKAKGTSEFTYEEGINTWDTIPDNDVEGI